MPIHGTVLSNEDSDKAAIFISRAFRDILRKRPTNTEKDSHVLIY